MTSRVVYNSQLDLARTYASAPADPLEFHRSFAEYEPTPLREWPELADQLGVRQVYVKLETDRLGLPSFKILGASWAAACALAARFPELAQRPLTVESFDGARPEVTLLAATDGNHGRALARIARRFGVNARILVPEDLSVARREAIAAEGATVQVVAGTYDDAVERSADEVDPTTLLVSDTAWPGYEETPRRVIEGYSTILREVEAQLAERGEGQPDLVTAQIGVGSLAAAITQYYRQTGTDAHVRIVGVEPLRAACVMASIAAGRRVAVPGPHSSIMAGLNCGVPSLLAWPVLSAGLDAVIAIDDEAARDGVRRLAHAGIIAGECAGAAAGALLQLLTGPDQETHRDRLGVDHDTAVLMLATEGPTDAGVYDEIVSVPSAESIRAGQ